MTEKAIHSIIHGRVQGVSFRWYTVQTAGELGLRGWVKNRHDGTVEVHAEGATDALEKLTDFLHEGPPAASVRRVDVRPVPATGQYADFRITYEGRA